MKNIVLRIFNLIKKGEINFMIKGISKRVFSKTEAFGLKRDLNIPFEAPNAQIDINIRFYKADDSKYFVKDLQNDGLIGKNIPNCYVATTTDDKPCFRQWLIGAEHKDAVKEFWGPSFPVLKENEMLLEGGFTIPSMRRNGIMPAAITRILDMEKKAGRRYVITFVGVDNIPSLKGIHRSGFSPYVLRTEKWLFFKRTLIFEDVPKEAMAIYSKNVGVTIT
ncbi:hypothetical protein [Winogradskyella sp.]|uniref:hypothetical protein n=1 Tax=Winogradskyella sp. TaxID=1883156 RepID=UPI001AFD7E54|nr:hypothetical protein [Winogradskyella sp.]MBO6881611.1 hypothetical protein [Winogradskyella sp.]